MNQRQIADILGVSQTTVSFVVDNPNTNKVSDSKRELILNFLEKNNYSSSKTKGKTRNIGYLPFSYISNEPNKRFYDRLEGIEEVAFSAGYNVIFEKYKKNNENLIFPHQKIDGIILEGSLDDDSSGIINVKKLQQLASRVPTVLLNHSVDADICDIICPDNSGGIQLAMSHLLSNGHKRIAYFAIECENCQMRSNYTQRLNAFMDSSRNFGLKNYETYIQTPFLEAPGIEETEIKVRETLERLMRMQKPPTALVCCNDFYALLMIRQSNLIGIKIPDELSIIGIDNIPNSELSFPALTTIDHNPMEMGRLSVETLINRIKNPRRPTRRIICNASLVSRESVINLKEKGE